MRISTPISKLYETYSTVTALLECLSCVYLDFQRQTERDGPHFLGKIIAPLCVEKQKCAQVDALRPPLLPAMQVRLKKVHAVSFWTWSSSDEVCAICQNPLDACAEGAEFPGDDSSVVWGECKHAFHLRCLTRWLQANNSCPICRRDWSFASDAAGAEKANVGEAPPHET